MQRSSSFLVNLLLLLCFNLVLVVVVHGQSEDVYIKASSSCVAECTQSSPYRSVQDFLTDYGGDLWSFSAFTFHLFPGVHSLPDGFDLGLTHSMSFIGEGSDRSKVRLQTCETALYKNASFQGLTLQNKNTCPQGLLVVYTMTLQLDDVVLSNPDGSGVSVQSASTLLTTDVTFSSFFENAVTVQSVSTWYSYGSLIVENVGPSENATAILIVDSSTWKSFGSVSVLNASRLAINIRQTSHWTSENQLLLEQNDNPVWITETSEWQQKGEVIFRENREVEVEHAVDRLVYANLVFLLSSSNWISKAPVRFVDNGPVASSLITLQNNCRLQSYFTFVVESTAASPLFTCTNSELFTNEPCTFECSGCEQLPGPLPVVSWSIDPSYLRLDQNGQVILLSIPDPVFSIRVTDVQLEPRFDIAIVTDGRKGSEDVDLGDGLVSMSPGTPQLDFAFSVLAFDSSSPFSLLLRAVEAETDQQPKYFVSGDQSRVDVVLSRPLDLPSMDVRFPFGTPDFLLTPLTSSSSPSASSSVLSNFTRLVEVNGETGAEVRSVFIEELSWQPSLSTSSPTSKAISFSAVTPSNDALQFTFFSYEEGETLTLKDGTTLPPFDKDIIKWSFRVEHWDWANEAEEAANNELVLEMTFLNYGGDGWTSFQEETILLDGADNNRQQKEFSFASTELSATLRALAFVWIDGDYETAVPMQVNVAQRPEGGGAMEWKLRLAFPHFGSGMEYDPDLSVVVEGSEGDKDDGGDDSDDLWWKVTVPILIVAALAVVVVVAVVFHVYRKSRLSERHKTLERVKAKSAELGD
ncbi:hypothetical protein QOT17_022856 [Balamuthia mandrillaris]